MNPFDPNGRTAAIRRGRRILDLLQKNGVISRDERDLARRQIGSLVVPPAGERPEEALHAVLRLARDSSAWKAEKREVVQTTLDLDLQALVESEMQMGPELRTSVDQAIRYSPLLLEESAASILPSE